MKHSNHRFNQSKEKFEDKAYDCGVPLIKVFCDVLHINRPHGAKKKDLIEILINFLAEPSESLVSESSAEIVEAAIASSSETRKKKRGRPKSKTPTKKKRGRPKKNKTGDEPDDLDFVSDEEVKEAKAEEVKEEEPEYDDDDQDEEVDGKTIPSAKKLRAWVKAYVVCFNLDKCNAKHAINTASEKFEVDLSDKKSIIMQMLKDEM